MLDLDLGRGLSGTRLLRYDARGHGRSTGRAEPSDYRWQVLADDLLRLLDAWFPGEQVHGVGPSMGTATLLHAAVRDPERFDGLTLLCPSTAWVTRGPKAEAYRSDADLIEREGFAAFVEAGEGAPPPPATVGTPHTVPDVAERILPSLLRGAAMSDYPKPDALRDVTARATILAWVDDPAHPVSTAELLAELLPDAELHVAATREDVLRWPTILRDDVARHGTPHPA
ncbi:hydrolase [Pseudoclavibacter endophyticus]|nr:hydrolase [Pseudoclavibacter endophyticus]